MSKKHSDLFMPKQTQTREEMLKFLGAAATADSEADLDPVLSLFNPVDSRKEMGEKFEETLGYNPITHYDFRDVLAAVDSVSIQISDEGRLVIENQIEDIAKRAMELLEGARETHINRAVVQALQEFLGKADVDAAEMYLFNGRPVVATEKSEPEPVDPDPLDDEDVEAMATEADEEDEPNRLLLDDEDLDDDDTGIPELDEDDVPEFGDDDDDD